jgi:hypothetical protein
MDRQLLENILVTALEGGSNYWYHINSANHKKVRDVVAKSDDPYFATAMLTAILDHGVQIEVHDIENPDEVLGVLTTKKIEEGLYAAEMSLDYGWAYEAEQNGTGDAETSDILFQHFVIGEVWFS